VSIGAAEGQNWWCCLFPPICKSAATVSQNDAEDAFVAVGLTSDQYKIITETDRPVYRVRFKILEVLGSLW
jgi:stage II sporulation protein R